MRALYLLKRNLRDGGGYVAKPGMKSSYTRSLRHARKFETRGAAEASACHNERVVTLASEVGEPD